MAGEGSKYIQQKSSKEMKKLIQKYIDHTKSKDKCTIGKINFQKNKIKLPDGSEKPVSLVGDIGQYAYVCNDGKIAHNSEYIKNTVDSGLVKNVLSGLNYTSIFVTDKRIPHFKGSSGIKKGRVFSPPYDLLVPQHDPVQNPSDGLLEYPYATNSIQSPVSYTYSTVGVTETWGLSMCNDGKDLFFYKIREFGLVGGASWITPTEICWGLMKGVKFKEGTGTQVIYQGQELARLSLPNSPNYKPPDEQGTSGIIKIYTEVITASEIKIGGSIFISLDDIKSNLSGLFTTPIGFDPSQTNVSPPINNKYKMRCFAELLLKQSGINSFTNSVGKIDVVMPFLFRWQIYSLYWGSNRDLFPPNPPEAIPVGFTSSSSIFLIQFKNDEFFGLSQFNEYLREESTASLNWIDNPGVVNDGWAVIPSYIGGSIKNPYNLSFPGRIDDRLSGSPNIPYVFGIFVDVNLNQAPPFLPGFTNTLSNGLTPPTPTLGSLLTLFDESDGNSIIYSEESFSNWDYPSTPNIPSHRFRFVIETNHYSLNPFGSIVSRKDFDTNNFQRILPWKNGFILGFDELIGSQYPICYGNTYRDLYSLVQPKLYSIDNDTKTLIGRSDDNITFPKGEVLDFLFTKYYIKLEAGTHQITSSDYSSTSLNISYQSQHYGGVLIPRDEVFSIPLIGYLEPRFTNSSAATSPSIVPIQNINGKFYDWSFPDGLSTKPLFIKLL